MEIRHFVPPTVRVGDEARHPTFSQWGKVFPVDTPDGESCGLVKNMTLTGVVSGTTTEERVLSRLHEATKIFLNGRWLGIVADTREAARLANKMKKARHQGLAKSDLTQVEVVLDKNRGEVHISTDSGQIL